jgi:formylglycine-generating enzyme required for sulfatase activity
MSVWPGGCETRDASVSLERRAVGWYAAGITIAASPLFLWLACRVENTATPAQDARGADARMIHIVGGDYQGARMPDYLLDSHEVTAGAYALCVAARGCAAIPSSGDCNYGSRASHPMNCIGQRNASEYCRWRTAGGRLPTQLEFFWATRGRDAARLFPWGDAPPRPSLVNGCGTECVDELRRRGRSPELEPLYDADDGWVLTAPVGSHPAGLSRDGVHDLVGNVAEWTSDEHRGLKKIVGGSWLSRTADDLGSGRPSFRGEEERESGIGFRCARTVDVD